MAVQRLVGGGLVGVHIQTGSADLAGLQRSQQSGLVHIGAAGGVDDHHAVLHLGDVLRRDQRTAVHSGRVDGYEVRLGQQLVHLHIGDAQLLLDAGDVENIEGDDVHADGLGHDAQMLADAAKAHDAQGLALQLDALAVLLLLPLAVAHGVAGIGDVAGAGEHVAHGQLRHGLGGRPGGVFHGDAIGLGVLHVDVIHAYAAADDQLQLAALGLVDVVGADLSLGADHHHVEITQGLAQLIRLVELLHHLVAHLAQLRHRGLVHTVSNQNTHGNILLYYYNLLIFAGAGRWGRPPCIALPAGVFSGVYAAEIPRLSRSGRHRRQRSAGGRDLTFPLQVVTSYARPRTFSGTPPAPQHPRWAWRCTRRRADRPRTCGPSGCRNLRPWWRPPPRRPARRSR